MTAGNTLLIGGNIANRSGTGSGLTKTDTGTLVLSGVNNTYGQSTAGTLVSNGTLQLGADNAVGVGLLTVASPGTFDLNGFNASVPGAEGNPSATITNSCATLLSTLTLTPTGAHPFGGNISGNLAVVKSNAGTETFAGTLTYTGGTTINSGGILQIGNSTGNVSLPASFAFVDNGSLVFGSTGNTTVAGNISGNGGVVVAGAGGSLTLSGTNTYTGNTSILAGTLMAGNSNVLGNATTSTVLLLNTSGANNASLLTSGPTTIANNIIVQAGSTGTATLGTSDANADTFSGNITLNRVATLSDTVAGGSSNFTGILSGDKASPSPATATWPCSSLNTYTGATSIVGANATLIANSVAIEGAAGGNASSIGASGNAAANFSLNGGTLQYIGANATTDHYFTLSSNSTINVLSGINLIIAASNIDTFAIIKTGTGTLTLAGAPTIQLGRHCERRHPDPRQGQHQRYSCPGHRGHRDQFRRHRPARRHRRRPDL